MNKLNSDLVEEIEFMIDLLAKSGFFSVDEIKEILEDQFIDEEIDFSKSDIHLNNSLNITPELIGYLTTGLELIKVVEAEFYKIMPKIAQNLNIMNRSLLEPIQEPLKRIQEAINKKFKEHRLIDEYHEQLF